MLKPYLIPVLAAIFVLGSGFAKAMPGGQDYRCTIERYSMAEGDSGSSYAIFKKAFVGQQFTVDRASGITIGTLKNAVASRPYVIDRGN